MNYIIRKKEQNDCKSIAHVVTISWNETYKKIVPESFLKNMYINEDERARNSFNLFNEQENHEFVLEVDGEVVGFINVGESEDNNFPDYGEICALYIISKYKGYGFGKKLFNAGIEELKKMGFNKMIIGCLDGNNANEFYKHIGGKFVRTRIFTKLNLPENVYVYDRI